MYGRLGPCSHGTGGELCPWAALTVQMARATAVSQADDSNQGDELIRPRMGCKRISWESATLYLAPSNGAWMER